MQAQASRALLPLALTTKEIMLTNADGLSNPTSAAVHGNTVYITSGAYFTATDPNLLEARITH